MYITAGVLPVRRVNCQEGHKFGIDKGCRGLARSVQYLSHSLQERAPLQILSLCWSCGATLMTTRVDKAEYQCNQGRARLAAAGPGSCRRVYRATAH